MSNTVKGALWGLLLGASMTFLLCSCCGTKPIVRIDFRDQIFEIGPDPLAPPATTKGGE